MKSMNELANPEPINESAVYDDVISRLEDAKENGTPIEEGLFTALFAGTAAVAIGPSVMKAVCECVGIDQKGPLGTLMTSKLVLGAMAAKLGWKA